VTRATGAGAPGGDGTRVLEGYGAGLVRERALAMAVQRALERLYQLERAADVHAFMTEAEEDQREALLVHDHGDGTIEMALRVPRLPGQSGDTFDVGRGTGIDPLCQIIEGVSHFVYIADRARVDREATHLELEMQAEVDKYVVLASAVRDLDVRASTTLRRRLFEDVSFSDAAGSETGERYRIANDLAHTFVRRLEQDFVAKKRYPEMRTALRHFYRLGQEDKLRLARAA
jgi:hypothetical protein